MTQKTLEFPSPKIASKQVYKIVAKVVYVREFYADDGDDFGMFRSPTKERQVHNTEIGVVKNQDVGNEVISQLTKEDFKHMSLQWDIEDVECTLVPIREWVLI